MLLRNMSYAAGERFPNTPCEPGTDAFYRAHGFDRTIVLTSRLSFRLYGFE